MPKIYRTPIAAAIGAADVLTGGLWGTLSELSPVGHPTFTKTTHTLLDI
jgi:hypothetical protein